MDNIINVNFGTWNSYYTDDLYQWDKGQIIRFDASVPDGAEVQFTEGYTKIVTGGEVSVPDILLETEGKHKAYVQIIGSDNETTIKELNFTVKARKQKSDYVPPEDEQTFREQMEVIMDTAAQSASSAATVAEQAKETADSVKQQAESGAFDGKPGKDYDHSEEYTELTRRIAEYNAQIADNVEQIGGFVNVAEEHAEHAEQASVSAGQHANSANQSATNAEQSAVKAEEAAHQAAVDVDSKVAELNEALAHKIDAPVDAPIVGKVLKIKSVNEDGTFLCEWADAPSGGGAVDDVTVNGASVVTNGVAKLTTSTSYGTTANGGEIRISGASENDINNRTETSSRYKPLILHRLVYAVNSVLCSTADSEQLTDEQQTAAQQRLGILSSEGVLF